MLFISDAYAQTAAAGGDMQSTLMSMLPLLAMFGVLYFVMVRPQMKRQKEHRALIASIAKGDPVVTSGGIIGKVTGVADQELDIEIASGVIVKVQRHTIVQVLPK